MKIGYPCINLGIGCQADKTFRLKSYTDENMLATVENNLNCLQNILEYNKKNGFFFFRISSETVPFASHPVNKYDWAKKFAGKLGEIGEFVNENGMRISMHPDQFVLINSPNPEIVKKSVDDLAWHAKLLDGMNLDRSAKIQIHVGGVYGEREAAMARFCENYAKLPEEIRKRLVIENDDVSYPLSDCMKIHKKTGVPILFDTFHHEVLNCGESTGEAFGLAAKTWKKVDGVPMVDYSSQEPDAKRGKHASTIDVGHFRKTMAQLKGEFDVMLEIKDKETSAKKALEAVKK